MRESVQQALDYIRNREQNGKKTFCDVFDEENHGGYRNQSELPSNLIFAEIMELCGVRPKLSPTVADVRQALKLKDREIESLSPRERMQLLELIRLMKLREAWDNPMADVIKTYFVKEAYKDSLHFFMEILQNVDDVQPEGQEKRVLKIQVEKAEEESEFSGAVVFRYSDRGFNFSDVYGISSIGKSTKKTKVDENGTVNTGSIGEKGIGFKSIFAVASRVEIKSKYFSFALADEEGESSSITYPNYLTDATTAGEAYDTELRVYLKKDIGIEKDGVKIPIIDAVKNWLETELFQSGAIGNSFLYLKSLNEIEYCTDAGEEKKVTIERTLLAETKAYGRISEIKIKCKSAEEKETITYLKYAKDYTFGKDEIVGRWNYLKEELKELETVTTDREFDICFPVLEKAAYSELRGKIYSYLPTNIEYDLFPVFINIDAHLSASRGNISASDFVLEGDNTSWNKQLKEYLPEFLTTAYKEVLQWLVEEDGADELKQKLKEVFYQFLAFSKKPDYIGFRDLEKNGPVFVKELNEFRKNIEKEAIIYTNKGDFRKKEEVRQFALKHVKYEERVRLCYWLLAEYSLELPGATYPKDADWHLFFNDMNPRGNLDIYLEDLFACAEQKEILIFDRLQRNLQGVSEEMQKSELLECIRLIMEELGDKLELLDKLHIIPTEQELVAKKGNYIFFRSDIASENPECQFVHEDYFGEELKENLRGFLENKCKVEKYVPENFMKEKLEQYLSSDVTTEKLNEFLLVTYPICKGKIADFSNDTRGKLRNVMTHYMLPVELLKESGLPKDKLAYVKELEQYIGTYELYSLEELNFLCTEPAEKVAYLLELGLRTGISLQEDGVDGCSKKIAEKHGFSLLVMEKDGKVRANPKFLDINLQNGTVTVTEPDSVFGYYWRILGSPKKRNGEPYVYSEKQKQGIARVFGITDEASKKVFVHEKEKLAKFITMIQKYTGYETYSLEDSVALVCAKETAGVFGCVGKNMENAPDEEKKNLIVSFQKEKTLTPRILYCMNKSFGWTYHWTGVYEFPSLNILLLDEDLIDEELTVNNQKCKLLNDFSLAKESEESDLTRIDQWAQENNLSLKDIFSWCDFIDGGAYYETLPITEYYVYNGLAEEYKEIVIRRNNQDETKRKLLKGDKKLSSVIIRLCAQLFPVAKLIEGRKDRIRILCNETDELKIKRRAEIYKAEYLDILLGELHEAFRSKFRKDNMLRWMIGDVKDAPMPLYDDYSVQWKTGTIYTEGYKNTCPICGRKSAVGTAGMKYLMRRNRSDSNNKILYFLTCFDCNNLLRGAKNVEIVDLDRIVDDGVLCYVADDKHPVNFCNMMTVTVKIELEGMVRYYPMKLSYENLLYYLADREK